MIMWATFKAEEAVKICNGEKKLNSEGYWDIDDFNYWMNKAKELGLV